MRITPESGGAHIVLLGAFNPPIFRPEWFAANGILGKDDAASANVELLHTTISVFSLSWGRIAIDQKRFAADATVPPFVRVRDLVVCTFKQYLMHTPIYHIGINRTVHFNVSSFEARDKIGRLLAPQTTWGEWGKQIAGPLDDRRKRGGMVSLSMSQMARPDGLQGRITAKIEPSPLFVERGIFMDINDHYAVGEPDDILGAEPAMHIIEEQWEKSIARSEWIVDQIMALDVP